MSGLLAVDAGQTGIRLSCSEAPGIEFATAGVLTDRPLMPQLATAIDAFVTEYRLAPEAVGVGSSGLVTPEAGELLGLVSRHGVRRVSVAHDATTSYLGALGDRPGVVIAAGTGVVTLAVGPTSVARVDGWGYLIGDAGSGYWIGRAGMEAALRGFDGRGQLTPLTERMRELFPDLAAAYVELQSDERRVSRIADFAKVVSELAEVDPVACAIIDAAAAELSDSVLAGLHRVDLMSAEPPTVCALGQVLGSAQIRTRFTRYLRMQWPGLELSEPIGHALTGAALLDGLDSSSPLSALVARATLD